MSNLTQNQESRNTKESPALNAVLQKLEPYGVYSFGSGWCSRCPAHKGLSANSLTIDFKEDKVLFSCVRKCHQADIEKVLGLAEEQSQATIQKPPQDPPQDNSPKKEPTPERPVSSPVAPISKDVSVLTFIKNLQELPACLKVEAQEKGGWLVECPGCKAYHPGTLALGVNQIGPDIVVRCAAGCSDEDLLSTLSLTGDGIPTIAARQWLEREVARGHERTYLEGCLARLLPLPPELRPPTIPKARTWDEFMELDPTPQESLCGQWFITGGLVMVSGDSGAGKTWFALNLALSVSTGVDFMKWSVPKARKVLLVSGEDKIKDLQQRGRSLLKTTKKPLLTFLNANDLARLPGGIPNLVTPEGRALVENNLEGVELVILDNYSTLFNGVDENDAKEFAPIQEWLFHLKARGISVLLVSHTGKNGDHRGSSKKVDGLNASILLNHPANWKASDGASFNLQFKKSRDARGTEVDPFSARLGEDEQGSLCWLIGEVQSSPVTRPSPKTDQILELHTQGKTPKEIILAGYNKSMVYAVLATLKESTHDDPGVSPVQSSLVPPKGGVTRLDSGRTKEPKSSPVQSSPVTRLDSKQTRPIELKREGPPGARLDELASLDASPGKKLPAL